MGADAMKPNVKRSGERLCRLAYELEALAARLADAGYSFHANSVKDMARTAGSVGRDLDRLVRKVGEAA
jgi:hypothetical protein